MPGDFRGGWIDFRSERVFLVENARNETSNRLFPFFIRLNPVAVHLRFFYGFEHIPLNAGDIFFIESLAGERPSSQQGLIKKVFFVGAWCDIAFYAFLEARVQIPPFVNPGLPLLRDLAEHRNSSPQ